VRRAGFNVTLRERARARHPASLFHIVDLRDRDNSIRLVITKARESAGSPNCPSFAEAEEQNAK